MPDNKKEQEREELHRAIWAIADDLRGSVDGWDFKSYVLGIMFYRYISENLTNYINADEIAAGNADFDYAKLSDEEAEQARDDLVQTKGFFILPSELFVNVRARAPQDDNLNMTMEAVFRHIEDSAKGTESEDDFAGLFDDIDVNSNKLGATVAKRNAMLVKLLDGIGAMKLGEYNRMVAPYRKSQSSYLPNVFLPSKKAMQADVEFVHPHLYEKCRSFFEKVLHLKAPDEYEHFVKSLEKRYADAGFEGPFEEHVQDIHTLVKYLRNSDYEDDLRQIVRKSFYIKCRAAGKAYWVRPHSTVIRFPQSETGLMLEQYYKGIAPDIYFVDFDAYQSAGITFDDLRALGVTDKIITGDEKTWGEYYTGNPGRQPEWRTAGAFRWKLGIDKLEEALLYISQHPKSKDALIKSQVIFKTLQENMARLVGTVYVLLGGWGGIIYM